MEARPQDDFQTRVDQINADFPEQHNFPLRENPMRRLRPKDIGSAQGIFDAMDNELGGDPEYTAAMASFDAEYPDPTPQTPQQSVHSEQIPKRTPREEKMRTDMNNGRRLRDIVPQKRLQVIDTFALPLAPGAADGESTPIFQQLDAGHDYATMLEPVKAAMPPIAPPAYNGVSGAVAPAAEIIPGGKTAEEANAAAQEVAGLFSQRLGRSAVAFIPIPSAPSPTKEAPIIESVQEPTPEQVGTAVAVATPTTPEVPKAGLPVPLRAALDQVSRHILGEDAAAPASLATRLTGKTQTFGVTFLPVTEKTPAALPAAGNEPLHKYEEIITIPSAIPPEEAPLFRKLQEMRDSLYETRKDLTDGAPAVIPEKQADEPTPEEADAPTKETSPLEELALPLGIAAVAGLAAATLVAEVPASAPGKIRQTYLAAKSRIGKIFRRS